MAVFELYDLREGRFAVTHGAGWCWWPEESVGHLIGHLLMLERVMIREYGIDPHSIETAFATIPEYRRFQTNQGRSRRTFGGKT